MLRIPPLLAAALLAAAGCSSDDGDPAGVDAGTDPGTDAAPGGDAAAGDPDAAMPVAWSFADVHGVPNLDDDDGGRTVDFAEAPSTADDDYAVLTLPGELLAELPAGSTVQLSLAGDADRVHVWHDGELLLGEGVAAIAASLEPAGEAIDLQIEFSSFAAAAELSIAHMNDAGELVESAVVALRAAPLILNHHLLPAEHLWAVRVGGNAAFLDAYETALGDAFTSVPGNVYGYDVWIQDEIEFATATGAAGERLDVVIDSIRNRGLDDFPEDRLVGPGVIAPTWGNPINRSTYDSFGNLEVSPPVTVGGVDYPHGRIFYGRLDSYGLDDVLADFLAEQAVQEPFEIDTTWLCVGHVDEFSSTVPDPSSPKGFKLLMADVPSAVAILEGLDPATQLPLFAADHGYPTVGSMLADTSLMALNADLQADRLEPIKAQMMAELGLTEEDVLLVPTLFERVPGCNGRVVALVPGMVNLIVANLAGQAAKLFVPDPFFRTDLGDQASDPFIEAFTDLMPEGLELHYIDNWDVYHMGLGEVHCGTNVMRTPTGGWWNELEDGGE